MTRQHHAAVPTSETPGADCKDVRDLYHPLNSCGAQEPAFYAFDLLWLDGEDLRQMPLIERKKRLARLVRPAKCSRLLYAQHIEQRGKGFFAEICARDLEGIVAKRKTGCIVENHEEAQNSCRTS